MPYIERTIFSYAVRDVCLKKIIAFENNREVSVGHAKIHPKNNLENSRNLIECLALK
jgi:hypothetical protein